MASIRKNPALLLSLLYAIFILYGTTIPFDLTCDPQIVDRGIAAIRWTPFQRVTGLRESLPDMATNLLLFIPLGALLSYAGYRSRRLKYHLIALMLGILGPAALSAVVETLQIFSPTRVTSITDLMLNIGGAACGAIASYIFYRWARDPFLSWCRREILRSPATLLLTAYIILLAMTALAPFDVSLDVSYVKQGLRMARFDPIADPTPWPKMLGNLLWFAGLCYLLCYVLRVQLLRLRTAGAIIAGLVISCFLAIGLEIAQILVASRVFTTRDILAGLIGALYGGLLFLLLNVPALRSRRQEHPLSGRGLYWLVAVHYLIYVMHEALYPYAFQLPSDVSDLLHGSLLPFSAYYGKTSVLALFDFLGGIVRYIPLGFFLQGDSESAPRGAKWRAVALCLGLGLMLEGLQLGVAERYADISDVIAAGCGGYVGWLLWRWWQGRALFQERGEQPGERPTEID